MPDTSELLLPPGTRMVHIGPPKTGSTAIQNALHGAREALDAHGVVYAGKGTRPREAGWAVLGMGVPTGRPPARIEAWHELVREVAEAGELRVCISDEDWGKADVAAARRITEGFGGDRVHIVSVVRRLDALLPSTWQERVKARNTFSYEDWLAVVLSNSPHSPVWRNFWIPQDVEALVDRWAQTVNRDQISLIVSDDTDRQLLPTTFELMLGLPEGLLRLDADLSNRSLSMNEVELVRHVNQYFVDRQWPTEAYWRLIQGGLVRGLKSVPRSGEDQAIPPLPTWAADRVDELSDRRADVLRSLGVRVIGDPECLRRSRHNPSPAEAEAPISVSIELAARAVQGTVAGALAQESRIRAAHKRKLRRSAGRGRRRVEDSPVRDVTTPQLLKILSQRTRRALKRPAKSRP